MSLTNAERAAWARVALDAFTGCGGNDGDMQTDIKDLITDLLHLARRECLVQDVVHFATLAAFMHNAEVEEEEEE